MGNAQAAELGKCGYRVLGVQPNSPASKVGLVSFFDFIVAADGECSCLARAVFANCFREVVRVRIARNNLKCTAVQSTFVCIVPGMGYGRRRDNFYVRPGMYDMIPGV